MMGFDGHDGYTGTIVIIEAVGPRSSLLALHNINFGAAYLRLQSYRPSISERRADELAADIDESLRMD